MDCISIALLKSIGTLKDGKKSDPASVNKASQWREEYMTAFDNGTLSLEPDDEVE